VEVLDHSLEDNALLHVLLAEIRNVWLCDVEQFRTDCGYTSEEVRSGDSFQLLCQRLDGYERAFLLRLVGGEA